MNRTVFTLVVIVIFILPLYAQTHFPSYYEQNKFNLTSPGAFKFGLYGYDNPAFLALQPSADLYFTWNNKVGSWSDFNNWGLFAAFPNVGFGVVRNDLNNRNFNDYKISGALGGDAFAVGIGVGWSSGDTYDVNRATYFTVGSYYRPNPFLSFGLIGNFSSESVGESTLDFAVRPLANEVVTLFGDYLIGRNKSSEEIDWSAGVVVEPVDGLRLTGRYFSTDVFNLGVQLSFGSAGITTQINYDKDGNHSFNSYGIRIGAYDRHPFTALSKNTDYVKINLLGPLKYQRYRYFDNSNTLIELLKQIDAAADDESVAGIAINTSGMRINREMIWELREQLKMFKSKGKKVVIYIDRVGINEYQLASVADKIVIDPIGSITLQGFILGRQYYKGTLEKIGIGFRELRYFKYKSAAETFANDKMSEADREQRQKLVDDFYKLAKIDISEGRGFTNTKFDNIVNNQVFFLSAEALAEGLVDTIARWDAIDNIIEKIEGDNKRLVKPGSLREFKLPNDYHWGKKPQIALIYAIGACAMDRGIKARTLVNYVQKAVDDDNVKAIILRVDSPGGDGLASDLIAEVLKKANGKKPVFVSQGFVAASGGYWLSMYADTIIAAPTTITGSIGVIGGYYFNKSFKEELGVTTDYVKRGKHADLGFGMRLPLLNIPIPNRDLNDEELLKFESAIKSMYKEFVQKVANGRNKTYDEIEDIAEGRIWSGYDAKKNGLVDLFGGLSTAIELAEEKSGLNKKDYDLVEYPQRPWFNFGSFIPILLGIETEVKIVKDPLIEDLKFRLKFNGYPMPILPQSDMGMMFNDALLMDSDE
ncbi:MAG: signal peptide peptidase SppA [Bacteroidetes bacterium]|nr:signal peptide peptidase SppA [Bacteroidota bacterium]